MTGPDGGDLSNLARQVVAARLRRGWRTREDFAENIDVSYRVLSDLETGRRRLGPDTYAKVEEALGWTPGATHRALAGETTGFDSLPDDEDIDLAEAYERRQDAKRRYDESTRHISELIEVSLPMLDVVLSSAERAPEGTENLSTAIEQTERLIERVAMSLGAIYHQPEYEGYMQQLLGAAGRLAVVKQGSSQPARPRGTGKVEVYEDSAGKFRFRIKAGNGEVLATGQAYASRKGAHDGAAAVSRALQGVWMPHTPAELPAYAGPDLTDDERSV